MMMFKKLATPNKRRIDIIKAIKKNTVATSVRERLEAAHAGKMPWIATLSTAELLITRSHGIRPIASVSATCWLHYGYSWSDGHSKGWRIALQRLREEAKAAGANAVLDVKMHSLPLAIKGSMDFTLTGTAVKIDHFPASTDPIIVTLPALEFIKLLEADIVPTGIAVGAHRRTMRSKSLLGKGNIEYKAFSTMLRDTRNLAHKELLKSAKEQGNGILAHINLTQIFEEGRFGEKRYLARHIVIATTVDTPIHMPINVKNISPAQTGRRKKISPEVMEAISNAAALERTGNTRDRSRATMPHEFQIVVDLHAGKTPLTGTTQHHQAYTSNIQERAA